MGNIGRSVVYARLHSTYFVHGLGQIETTMEVKLGSKISGMKRVEDGIDCEGNGAHGPVQFFIPFGNIIGITYGEDAKVLEFKKK